MRRNEKLETRNDIGNGGWWLGVSPCKNLKHENPSEGICANQIGVAARAPQAPGHLQPRKPQSKKTHGDAGRERDQRPSAALLWDRSLSLLTTDAIGHNTKIYT